MNPNACVPNIGVNEQRRRMIIAVVMVTLAGALAAGLVLIDAPRIWGVLVFLPTWVGALGFFQMREKTCVVLAARGVRNMDSGDEPIADPGELRQVRAQARRVHRRAAGVAAIATAVMTAALNG